MSPPVLYVDVDGRAYRLTGASLEESSRLPAVVIPDRRYRTERRTMSSSWTLVWYALEVDRSVGELAAVTTLPSPRVSEILQRFRVRGMASFDPRTRTWRRSGRWGAPPRGKDIRPGKEARRKRTGGRVHSTTTGHKRTGGRA